MMRNIVAVIIVTVVAPFACADDKEKAIAKDKKALQGVWLVDAAYQDGKEVPRADREKEEYCLYAVKVADDQFQVAWLRNKTEYGNLVPFSLNPGASPKVLEWQNGDRKAGVAYAIDGDKLTICFHMGDNGFDKDKVPAKLETKSGDQRYMFVFKRSKEK